MTPTTEGKELIVHSCYYCPNCGKNDDEGDLFVKDYADYVNKKPYTYFCTRCKGTFKIEQITIGDEV